MGQLVELHILSGQSVSEEFTMREINYFFGLISHGDWTAADIGFQVSGDGTNWELLKDDGGSTVKLTNIPTSGGFARVMLTFANALIPFQKIRLASLNTGTEAAVNQGADRTFYVNLGS